MDRQIFLLVLFATLMQNSSGTVSQNTIDHDDGSVFDVCAIQASEEATISEYVKGTDITFTALRSEISKVNNRNKTTGNREANLTAFFKEESYNAYKKGIDIMLDAALCLWSIENCWGDATAPQLTRNALYMGNYDIFKAIVHLSTDKNNPELQSIIEMHEEKTLSKPRPVVEGIFMAIINGQKRSDEIEFITTSYKEKAINFIVLAIRKIFTAIKIAANMSPENQTESENCAIAVGETQNESISAFVSFVRTVYDFIRIFYTVKPTTEINTSTMFATVKSLQEKRNQKIKQGVEIIFEVIKSIASNFMDGSRNPNRYQTCIREIAENEAYEIWLDEANYLLDLNSLVQPVSDLVDTSSRFVSSLGLKNEVTRIFDGIELVQTKNYAECMIGLERIQNRTIFDDLTLTTGLYIAAKNNLTDSHNNKILKIINDAQKRTISHAVNATISVFDGIRFLAKVISGNYYGQRNDWSVLDSAADRAYSGWKKETDIYRDLLEFIYLTSAVKQEEIVIIIIEIRSARDLAISEFSKGFRFLFTKIETDMKKTNSKNKTDPNEGYNPRSNHQPDNLSPSNFYKNQTLLAFKNAINTTFNILDRIHCANSSLIKSTLTASIVALIDAIDNIYQLIDAAGGDECSKIITELSDFETSSTNEGIDVFKRIFLSIRSGQQNSTVEDEAAIKQTELESMSYVVDAWNAVYHGIEILKTGTSSETEDGCEQSYSAMKAAENVACSAMEANLRGIFTLIQILTISSYAKPDKMSKTCSAVNVGRETAITELNNAIKIAFGSMKNFTSQNRSKYQSNTKLPTVEYSTRQCNESSGTRAAASAAYHALNTSVDATFDSISIIRPGSAAAVETARYGAHLAAKQLGKDIFFVIKMIQHNCSPGLLAQIDVLEKATKCSAIAVIQNDYIAMRYSINSNSKIYAELVDREKRTYPKTFETYDAVFSALRMFYHKVCCPVDVGNQNYLLSMNDAENKSLSASATVVEMTLLLTDPPTFNVTNLQINGTTTQLAIWGNCGIAVVELPKRWGKDAAFHGGKDVISCRSHSLDERLFQCSGITEVRRARWHPGSTRDCHLLVLTSENTFNLYECELNGSQALVKTWTVGPAFGSPSKIPTPASLGETAVDFDFASPTIKPDIDIKDVKIDDINWNHIEWPILVLKGNGDVYTVHGNILSSKADKPVVTGPLSVYPSADDNYGVDSCSIMCLQTTPPLVVVATSNGKLYHSILLQDRFDDDEKKSWSQYGSTFSLHTPEDALFVYECVEMELGLSVREDEKKYSCPVHLHLDRGNNTRYFCSHNAGIHIVNLPMISQLEEYITAKDEDAGFFLPNLSNQSSSQYLVCTRTKSTQEPAPILGFGLLQEPCILIALLHTGTAISLSVVDLHYLPKIRQLEPVISPSKKITKESFDVYIRSLLKHNVSQPILKLGPNAESTPQEVLELLLRATNVFRSEHFARQDKVRAEIAKRTRTLRALKVYQIKELETLVEMKKKLQESAELLAERYEDIKDKQEQLARRTEEVLRLINQRQPPMSPIEKKEANELKEMDGKTKELSQQLEKLKNKAKYQSEQLAKWDRNETKMNIVIGQSQNETIKTRLGQSEKEIAELLSKLKSLEEEILS